MAEPNQLKTLDKRPSIWKRQNNVSLFSSKKEQQKNSSPVDATSASSSTTSLSAQPTVSPTVTNDVTISSPSPKGFTPSALTLPPTPASSPSASLNTEAQVSSSSSSIKSFKHVSSYTPSNASSNTDNSIDTTVKNTSESISPILTITDVKDDVEKKVDENMNNRSSTLSSELEPLDDSVSRLLKSSNYSADKNTLEQITTPMSKHGQDDSINVTRINTSDVFSGPQSALEDVATSSKGCNGNDDVKMDDQSKLSVGGKPNVKQPHDVHYRAYFQENGKINFENIDEGKKKSENSNNAEVNDESHSQITNDDEDSSVTLPKEPIIITTDADGIVAADIIKYSKYSSSEASSGLVGKASVQNIPFLKSEVVSKNDEYCSSASQPNPISSPVVHSTDDNKSSQFGYIKLRRGLRDGDHVADSIVKEKSLGRSEENMQMEPNQSPVIITAFDWSKEPVAVTSDDIAKENTEMNRKFKAFMNMTLSDSHMPSLSLDDSSKSVIRSANENRVETSFVSNGTGDKAKIMLSTDSKNDEDNNSGITTPPIKEQQIRSLWPYTSQFGYQVVGIQDLNHSVVDEDDEYDDDPQMDMSVDTKMAENDDIKLIHLRAHHHNSSDDIEYDFDSFTEGDARKSLPLDDVENQFLSAESEIKDNHNFLQNGKKKRNVIFEGLYDDVGASSVPEFNDFFCTVGQELTDLEDKGLKKTYIEDQINNDEYVLKVMEKENEFKRTMDALKTSEVYYTTSDGGRVSEYVSIVEWVVTQIQELHTDFENYKHTITSKIIKDLDDKLEKHQMLIDGYKYICTRGKHLIELNTKDIIPKVMHSMLIINAKNLSKALLFLRIICKMYLTCGKVPLIVENIENLYHSHDIPLYSDAQIDKITELYQVE